jgi:hypothetical protein
MSSQNIEKDENSKKNEKVEDDNFNPVACKYRHEIIEQNLKSIMKNIDELKIIICQNREKTKEELEKKEKRDNDSNEEIKNELKRKDKEIKHELEEKIESGHRHREEIKNEVKLIHQSINSRLDDFDISLRGNGKIGIFEQLRSLRIWIKVCFALILLLFGARVFGATLNELFDAIFKINQTKTVQIETQKIEKKTENKVGSQGQKVEYKVMDNLIGKI